jgi:subtilisin family serine protease
MKQTLTMIVKIQVLWTLVLRNVSATELLVKWRIGPDTPAVAARNTTLGATVKRTFISLGWQCVEPPISMTTDAALEAYEALPEVLAVEVNGRVFPELPASLPPLPEEPGHTLSPKADDLVPNDPMFSEQWYLRKIGAPEAWSAATGSQDVVVAILDTGVDYTHPELAANMWKNPGETGFDADGKDKATNGLDDDGNGYIDDVYGVDVTKGAGDPMDLGFWWDPTYVNAPDYHGTQIAGLIGAVANNAEGIAGLNWSVRMMAVRMWGLDVSELNGQSDYPFYADLLAAYDYVVQMKRRGANIRVVNHSATTLVYSRALIDAIRTLNSEGILLVCAAGNYSANTDLYSNFPNSLSFPSILSIANSTVTDTLRASSCFGHDTVDLAAPGTDLVTTDKGGGYRVVTGTSFSAPIVSGAAALLLSVNPQLSVADLKAALFGSVDQPAALRGKIFTHGRLNVGRAVQYLSLTNAPAIITSAFPAGERTTADEPIYVEFSRPMNRSSVEKALVITPVLAGTFEWSADHRSFLFQHTSPFDTNTTYSVRILGTAQDESGQTLDGNFNRARESSPTDDFVWTIHFPVPNDDFVGAQLLTGSSGQVQGNNCYALWERNEPGQPTHFGEQLQWNTVWYRWTPPDSGWFTFDLTSGTTFDSLLDIYAGDQIERLNTITRNDNEGTRTGSRLSFAAAAGTTYYARVAGKDGTDPTMVGRFTLRWYPTPPPGFTGPQFSPSSAAPGAKVTLTGTNFTGAAAVLFNGVSATFTNAPTNNLDLRITAIVPPDATSGPITILTPHGNATSTAVFQVLRPTLALTQNANQQLTLSWSGTSYALESSIDLRVWNQVAPAGVTNYVTTPENYRAFFRLTSKPPVPRDLFPRHALGNKWPF